MAISAVSGFVTGAIGAKFPGAHRFVEGAVDTGASALERLAYAAFDDSMSWEEKLAYAFDPGQMLADFVTGVIIGEFLDGMMAGIQVKLRDIFENNNAAMREAFESGSDTVTYRRVQGGSGNNASQVRIEVNADGTISIPNKDANLSISIDGGEHAEYFLSKRGGDAQIVEVDVPKWFDDFLQENAIPQVNYKKNPRNQGGAAPKITDITTPGNCFELPAPWIEWLEEYGGNARIVNP